MPIFKRRHFKEAIAKIFYTSIILSLFFPNVSFAQHVDSSTTRVIQEVTGTGAAPEQRPVYPEMGFSTLNIIELSIIRITLNSAQINWKTDYDALCKFYWGTTAEYTQESISETGYNIDHSIKLSELFPTTLYHFRISCTSSAGGIAQTPDQAFRTLSLPDTNPPANVSGLEAIPADNRITLKWKNPEDSDFEGVRIVKSEKFYPTDIFDGEVVYTGEAEEFIDTDVENGKKYYYAVYSYDENGNYSSGAVIFSIPNALGKQVSELPPEKQEITAPAPPEVEKLTINDFDFFADGIKISLEDGNIIKADSGSQILISLKYEKVPEVLKTIMVTLEQGEKYFSFLLKINRNKTAYEAVIASPDAGDYGLIINVFDYKNQVLKKIYASLHINGLQGGQGSKTNKFDYVLIRLKKFQYVIYLLLLFVALVIFGLRKKTEKGKKIKGKKDVNLYRA